MDNPDREAIEFADEASIDRLVEREQACLMCQELADSDSLLAVLRELWPVRAYPLFVVEPSARVGNGERHRGQPLCGRVDQRHRVLLPRLTGPLVTNPAPQVDDFLAALKGTAGSAQLASAIKVLDERLAHSLKAEADVPLNAEAV